MISGKYINHLLYEYMKTPEGKKNIGYQLGKSKTYSKEEMLLFGNKMKDILYDHIVNMTTTDENGRTINPLRYFKKDDILVGKPVLRNGVEFQIKISFREGSLTRESFSPDERGQLENIILLFAKGYDAGKYTYGEFRGNKTRSRRAANSSDYLLKAVRQFNNENNGVAMATLEDKYL